MTIFNDFNRLQVVAPNFKRRLSGVTSTIIQLVPAQNAAGTIIATFGPGLPDNLPKIRYRDFWRFWKRPASGKKRIWHARRNTEMLAGIIMRDLLRMPFKLVFTSAAQRDHSSYTKWLIRRMDGTVATSVKSGRFLNVPHTVIMHGIDTDRFVPARSKKAAKQALQFDPERKLIGATGRIRPSKGTDLLVDAMIELLPLYPEWDVAITGRATSEFQDFKAGLEAKIEAAKLQKRIRFYGEVPDILPWYQAFDLFVAPSRNEGFGLTPLEAMACGVPVIASSAGSYEEMIIEGENGKIVKNMTPASLAAAIKHHILTNSGQQLAPTTINRFSLENEVEKLASFYFSNER